MFEEKFRKDRVWWAKGDHTRVGSLLVLIHRPMNQFHMCTHIPINYPYRLLDGEAQMLGGRTHDDSLCQDPCIVHTVEVG